MQAIPDVLTVPAVVPTNVVTLQLERRFYEILFAITSIGIAIFSTKLGFIGFALSGTLWFANVISLTAAILEYKKNNLEDVKQFRCWMGLSSLVGSAMCLNAVFFGCRAFVRGIQTFSQLKFGSANWNFMFASVTVGVIIPFGIQLFKRGKDLLQRTRWVQMERFMDARIPLKKRRLDLLQKIRFFNELVYARSDSSDEEVKKLSTYFEEPQNIDDIKKILKETLEILPYLENDQINHQCISILKKLALFSLSKKRECFFEVIKLFKPLLIKEIFEEVLKQIDLWEYFLQNKEEIESNIPHRISTIREKQEQIDKQLKRTNLNIEGIVKEFNELAKSASTTLCEINIYNDQNPDIPTLKQIEKDLMHGEMVKQIQKHYSRHAATKEGVIDTKDRTWNYFLMEKMSAEVDGKPFFEVFCSVLKVKNQNDPNELEEVLAHHEISTIGDFIREVLHFNEATLKNDKATINLLREYLYAEKSSKNVFFNRLRGKVKGGGELSYKLAWRIAYRAANLVGMAGSIYCHPILFLLSLAAGLLYRTKSVKRTIDDLGILKGEQLGDFYDFTKTKMPRLISILSYKGEQYLEHFDQTDSSSKIRTIMLIFFFQTFVTELFGVPLFIISSIYYRSFSQMNFFGAVIQGVLMAEDLPPLISRGWRQFRQHVI